jgi:alkylation response protein AidB-like acyl-CoA dehydrogenase
VRSIYFEDEHEQFRQAVRSFFQKEVDAEAWERERRIPREIWRKMGELGYLGISFAEAYGGTAADFFYSVVFLEELGRTGLGGFSAAVGVQQYMATAHIYKFGSEALKQRYVSASIGGERVGALAISEPDTGSDVAAIRTRARRSGDEWVISGTKTFITNGVRGDFATVAVKTGGADEDALSLIVVDRETPGFSAKPLDKMGWHCSDTGELTFEDVRVPADHLIGQEGKGFYYIMNCFQLERLVAALTAIGGADLCLAITLDYLKQRQAFGRPISKFQIIRHGLAELHSELEACRQLTYHACWRYARDLPAVEQCSMAKLRTTELGKRIADQCLQWFGGYGYMEEYPIARLYRDARVGTIVGGTSEIMREILAKMIIDGARYEPAAGGDTGNETALKVGLGEIMNSLPDRFLQSSQLKARVHFDLSGHDGGQYTVTVGESCTLEKGLVGEPDCAVETTAALYRDLELGRQTPQAAYLSGTLKVSDPDLMMRFLKSFKKFTPT